MKLYPKILSYFFLISLGQLYAQTHPVVNSIINSTNLDSLTKYVEELSGEREVKINGKVETILSRNKFEPGNEISAQYLINKMRSYGYDVKTQEFAYTGKNILCELKGTKYPDKQIIICGHYDSMPVGKISPGADDNASGSAAVIEAARIFRNYSFPYTVVFAFWDEEEYGLLGSRYYADKFDFSVKQILGVINLDMIAWENNGDNRVIIHSRDDGRSFRIADKLVETNDIYKLGLEPYIHKPGITASDHAAFWEKECPAVLVIEDDFDDFNDHYHSLSDRVSSFNFPYFHKNTQMSLGALAGLALDLGIDIQHTPVRSVSISKTITVEAKINSGMGLGSEEYTPKLYYRISNSDFTEVSGTLIGQLTGNYQFIIPAFSLGTPVEYYLLAQSADGSYSATLPKGGDLNSHPKELFKFFVAEKNILISDNVTGAGQWNVNNGWSLAETKDGSQKVFHDSPQGGYNSYQKSVLSISEWLNLNNSIGAGLSFKTKWDIENNWDYGQVQITTDEINWFPLEGKYTVAGSGNFQPKWQPVYDGFQEDWVVEQIDLSEYIGKQVKIRFVLGTDEYIHHDGWYLDDIEVFTYKSEPIKILDFDYHLTSTGINLQWQTGKEIDNLGYVIEKSHDNFNWIEVGFIMGRNSIKSNSGYSFVDTDLNENYQFYRLKNIDLYGAKRYYGPMMVEISNDVLLSFAKKTLNENPSYNIEIEQEIVNPDLDNSLNNSIYNSQNTLFEKGK